MIDKKQLPFLLRLVDDNSPQVRAKVSQALRDFGPSLGEDINELQILLSEEQKAVVAEILAGLKSGDNTVVKLNDKSTTNNPWLYWLNLPSETEKLEAAFTLLAEWQLGKDYPTRLPQLLDDLAREFYESGRAVDSEELCDFLFTSKGLHGAGPEHYYNPLNSNLVYVIENGEGLQISLASVFILIGKRLGLEIYGCNFPGHFLARARAGDDDLVFDCFNGGRLLSEAETEALRKAAPSEMSTPTPAVTMISRVLSNLALAFNDSGDTGKTQFILTLLNELQQANGE